MKGMTWVKKAEYKQEMAEKRKAHYSQYEPKIKAWFSEVIDAKMEKMSLKSRKSAENDLETFNFVILGHLIEEFQLCLKISGVLSSILTYFGAF